METTNENRTGILGHISWSAIFAGAVIAIATQFMFGLLGAGLGMAGADFKDGVDLGQLGTGALIWFFVTFLVSLFIGGYSASRLSANIRKGAGAWNSAVVWALVVGLNLAAASSGVSKLGQGIAKSVDFMTPEGDINITEALGGFSFEEVRNDVDELLRETNNEELKAVASQEYEDLKEAAKEAGERLVKEPNSISRVVDEFEQKAQASLEDIQQSLDQEDLAQAISAKTEMSQEEAQRAIESWKVKVSKWSRNFEAKFQQAKNKALMQAQEATQTSGRAAIYAFAILLLGMISSIIGGRLGVRAQRRY